MQGRLFGVVLEFALAGGVGGNSGGPAQQLLSLRRVDQDMRGPGPGSPGGARCASVKLARGSKHTPHRNALPGFG